MRRLTPVILLLASCGGATGQNPGAVAPAEPLGQPCTSRMAAMPDTDESKYAPLDVGADWATYKKVSKQPFHSKTHGGRFVEVYVNDLAFVPYTKDQPFPVGATIVKISWENEGGKPTATPGPIFVMRKQAAGYNPKHGDWFYGLHWEKPTAKQLELLKGPVYWRGKSDKVGYCQNCHDNYDREMGGIPKGERTWE